jgi:SAM-dependent methyltransferase
MTFICNITGKHFDLNNNELIHREGCCSFGYNSRFRAICYVFTKLFYGKCKILCDLEKNKKLKGIGMSDAGWSDILAEKFDYQNTYYHTFPYLDIYNEEHVKNYNDLDFIVSSDVFEHINVYPGLNYAFDNLYRMLKPGGILIFSVPYTHESHKEHYPNLYDYEIKIDNNLMVLHNKTINGTFEVFNKLTFHGGPGNVLEMRVFSKQSIIDYLTDSGFTEITFHEIDKDMNRYGIFWGDEKYALIITAKK